MNAHEKAAMVQFAGALMINQPPKPIAEKCEKVKKLATGQSIPKLFLNKSEKRL